MFQNIGSGVGRTATGCDPPRRTVLLKGIQTSTRQESLQTNVDRWLCCDESQPRMCSITRKRKATPCCQSECSRQYLSRSRSSSDSPSSSGAVAHGQATSSPPEPATPFQKAGPAASAEWRSFIWSSNPSRDSNNALQMTQWRRRCCCFFSVVGNKAAQIPHERRAHGCFWRSA